MLGDRGRFSDYEVERSRQIEANRAQLLSLGLVNRPAPGEGAPELEASPRSEIVEVDKK
jgi:hypothetical protein